MQLYLNSFPPPLKSVSCFSSLPNGSHYLQIGVWLSHMFLCFLLPVNVCIQGIVNIIFCFLKFTKMISYSICRIMLKLLFWDEKKVSVNLLLTVNFICLQLINFIDIGMCVLKLRVGTKSISITWKIGQNDKTTLV